MGAAAALVDRDGTINVQPPEHTYLTSAAELELLPGAVEGLARLAGCGFELVVISNQRGVGRGLIPDGALEEIGEAIQAALSPHGARIAGFYYCPHLIEGDCDCRKPRPGLLLRAADELGLDLARSWMVGDSASDIEAGAAAGTRTAYLGAEGETGATLAAPSLAEAAELICAQKRF